MGGRWRQTHTQLASCGKALLCLTYRDSHKYSFRQTPHDSTQFGNNSLKIGFIIVLKCVRVFVWAREYVWMLVEGRGSILGVLPYCSPHYF